MMGKIIAQNDAYALIGDIFYINMAKMRYSFWDMSIYFHG